MCCFSLGMKTKGDFSTKSQIIIQTVPTKIKKHQNHFIFYTLPYLTQITKMILSRISFTKIEISNYQALGNVR